MFRKYWRSCIYLELKPFTARITKERRQYMAKEESPAGTPKRGLPGKMEESEEKQLPVAVRGVCQSVLRALHRFPLNSRNQSLVSILLMRSSKLRKVKVLDQYKV